MTSESLAGALARRARDLAAPTAEAYASGNRVYTVTITRPAGRATFNRLTAGFTLGGALAVYTGGARLTPIATSGPIDILDESTYLTQVQLSIDPVTTLPPRVDDVAEITAVPAGAPDITGRVFRITGVTTGGHLDIGWVLTCVGIDPSRAQDSP